jgi:hypothetical protein
LRLSAIRRAEYLQLRLSPQIQSEARIRDAIQELLGTLDITGGNETWQAERELQNAVRSYVEETLEKQRKEGNQCP